MQTPNPDLILLKNVLSKIQAYNFTSLSSLKLHLTSGGSGYDAIFEQFRGLLAFLYALGVIEMEVSENDQAQICYVSDGARDFVLSIILCSQQGIPAIDTWNHRYINGDPVWGRLLREIEERRIHASPLGVAPEVLRREQVVIVVIKGVLRMNGKKVEVYLCQYDDKSKHYNFIGGKKLGNESETQTAERKMHDELGLPTGSFTVEALELIGKPQPARRISHDSGVFSEYTYGFFHAHHITGRGQPRSTNRWFTLEQLLSGKGPKGEKIMAHPEILEALRTKLSPSRYRNGLQDLSLSLDDPHSLGTNSKGRIRGALFDGERVNLFAGILTILSIIAAFLAWVLHQLGLF